MDWIRRNWPDLLIGFALLAVISGIVATLLTGGSFFPLGGGSSPSPRSEPQTVQTPLEAPAAQPGAADAGQGGGADITALPLLPPGPAPAGSAQGDLPDGPVDPLTEPAVRPAGQQAGGGVVAVRPGDSENTQGLFAPAATPPGQQQAQTTAPAEPQVQPAPAAQPTSSTAAGGTANGPTADVPYTVAVGAFRNAENAERQASVFRQAGYSVLVAAQDDLNVVLLGPYAAESEAARVRDAVATGGFDVQPIVYTYQDDEAEAAGTEPSAPAAAPGPAPAATPVAQPEPQPAPPAAAPPSTSAGRYLQVGAYGSQENATAQEQTLAGLGYAVTRQQDGGLIRILVGPYSEGELATARDRLAAQGIEAIPR